MRRNHLLGTVAALALLGGSALAQERVEMPNDGRYGLQMDDAGQPLLDDTGNPTVVDQAGATVDPENYRIDDSGEIILLVLDDEAEADATVDVQATQEVVGGDVSADAEGEFIVQQGEPTVNVEIPDPTVTVNQAQPQVTVEQPTPEITVQVAPPTVNVEQQAPVITVEQQEPVVTVRIPEPVVTIRLAEPEVQVSQADPNVQVETPQPVVRYVRPEPQIRVEQAEAQVQVSQAEPQVQINRTQAADVQIEQADAEVTVEETGEAVVNVTEAEPQVQVEQAEGADVQVETAEPQIEVEETGEPQVAIVDAEVVDREVDPEAVSALETEGYIVTADMEETEEQRATRVGAYGQYADMTVTDLVGTNVLAADGEDVGEVDNIAVMGDRLMAVVGIGGFLGLGEHDVALPLDRFTMEGDNLVVTGLSSDRFEALPQYDEASAEYLPTDGRLGDFYE